MVLLDRSLADSSVGQMVAYMKLIDWLDRLPWFVGFFFCGLLVGVLSHGFVLLVCQVGYLVACFVE